MNLEDVIDPEYGLQQDEWSLSKHRFGKDNQLTVVGWSGKCSTNIIYLLHCSECAKDTELFGEGYFKSLKSNLTKSQIPCGCSNRYIKTEAQWRVLLHRHAESIGCRFIDFRGLFKGKRTKVIMECPLHGCWDSTSIDSFLNQGTSNCPVCRTIKIGIRSKQDDADAIQDFLSTGSFHPDTKFWRSDKKDNKGKKPYWYMYCPVCEVTVEKLGSGLKRGNIGCDCSCLSQRNAYINLVRSDGIDLALKFGIANVPKRRAYEQNLRSSLDVIQLMVWTFHSSKSCKAAEIECKKRMDTGVLSVNDMPDGWTETTYLSNIDDIVSIYEKFGGILTFKIEEDKL